MATCTAVDYPFELRRGQAGSPVFLSCEHASNRMPEPWSWPAQDLRFRDTHWAIDIGAAELTRDLARALGAPAVLARFSRLLVDPNRELDHPDLFRRQAEGEIVELNRQIDTADRERRVDQLWRPYHEAIDRELARSPAPIFLAIHTFTPVYLGVSRGVEVGVLFDDPEEKPATFLREAILGAGFDARPNEPYSGRSGMMYSSDRHARAHGCLALELELRQDIALSSDIRGRLLRVLAESLRQIATLRSA